MDAVTFRCMHVQFAAMGHYQGFLCHVSGTPRQQHAPTTPTGCRIVTLLLLPPTGCRNSPFSLQTDECMAASYRSMLQTLCKTVRVRFPDKCLEAPMWQLAFSLYLMRSRIYPTSACGHVALFQTPCPSFGPVGKCMTETRGHCPSLLQH